MSYSVGASLNEICEVYGHPLTEEQLWSILQLISNLLIQKNSTENIPVQSALYYVITPNKVVILPSGIIVINHGEGDPNHILFCTPNMVQQYINQPDGVKDQLLLYSLSLTILWCADYGVKRNQIPTISSELQSLLDDISELKLNLEKLHLICSNYSKPDQSKLIASSLCASILGNMCLKTANKPQELESGYLEKQTLSNPTNQQITLNNISKQEKNISFKLFRKSLLSGPETLKTIPLNATCSGQSCNILVYLNNFSKVKVCCGGIESLKVIEITKVVVATVSTDMDDNFFGLATWIDSEFRFIDNNQKVESLPGFPNNLAKLHLRILFFPPGTQTLGKSLLRTMYLQLRLDLLQDRLICLSQEALSISALALQCELGDYKQKFGKDYFNLEEFLCTRVINEIGLDKINSELILLHKQLAGIDQIQSRLMFLRRCQQLHEYGMHFHKLYHKSECLVKDVTWLGVGPRGITLFDICNENIRVRKHVFKWNELKTISFKKNSVILSKLYPKIKFKFYQINEQKSSYIVSVVEKLHKFYARRNLPDIFSPIALFDDITNLSVSSNHSQQSLDSAEKISNPNTYPEVKTSLNLCNTEGSFIYESVSDVDNKLIYSQRSLKTQIFEVELKKIDESFGIKIVGGKGCKDGEKIRICELIEGGSAVLDGKIDVNDILVSINHISLCDKSHEQAVAILRSSSNISKLLLEREIYIK